ncbi:UNVERIFIED_CONTAM: hypothetical protein H355_011965 [Colinus virginianus]|nr:hypothetical protein H355_011965 [Colinus virginianus]
MIDCVEAFDAAAAAAAERTVKASSRLLDNQSCSHPWEKTTTVSAGAAPSEWKDAAAAPLNTLTSLSASAAALLFPSVDTASPPHSSLAMNTGSAATADAVCSKMVPHCSAKTATEADRQQKSVACKGDAASCVACDFLGHPVESIPAGDQKAGASIATPSVFSPCPSEATSPVLDASGCFSVGDCTSEDATSFPWDAASGSTLSSRQSTSRNLSKNEGRSSSRSKHNRNQTETEDARTPFPSPSVFVAAVDFPAAASQHRSTNGQMTPPGEGCFENYAALGQQPTIHDPWQRPSHLGKHPAAAATAGRTLSTTADAARVVADQILRPGEHSGPAREWDGPAPLEGGRTAATRDYYVGDEASMPAAADSSTPSTAVFFSLQQQREEVEESHDVADEHEDRDEQRMEEEPKERQHPLQQAELHADTLENSEWENDLPAEEETRTAAAEQESVRDSVALQIRGGTTEEEEEDEDEEEVQEKEGPPLLLFPFLRKAKVLKIAINEVLLLQQQTSYLLMLQPPSSPSAVPAAFCSSCNGGSSALERTLLFESSKEHGGGADAEAASAAFSDVTAGEKGTASSLCYTCELALHVNTAQQLLSRTHRALQQLLHQQEEEEARWHEEQQQQQGHSSMTFFLEQMHRQHSTAASAAELRIRRSVLRQQQHQLQVALEQQQQLEDDLKARWETEVLADMQILCPDRPQRELQQRLSQQLLTTEEQHGNAAAAAWLLVESSNCSTSQSDVSADSVAADSSTSTTTTGFMEHSQKLQGTSYTSGGWRAAAYSWRSDTRKENNSSKHMKGGRRKKIEKNICVMWLLENIGNGTNNAVMRVEVEYRLSLASSCVPCAMVEGRLFDYRLVQADKNAMEGGNGHSEREVGAESNICRLGWNLKYGNVCGQFGVHLLPSRKTVLNTNRDFQRKFQAGNSSLPDISSSSGRDRADRTTRRARRTGTGGSSSSCCRGRRRRRSKSCAVLYWARETHLWEGNSKQSRTHEGPVKKEGDAVARIDVLHEVHLLIGSRTFSELGLCEELQLAVSSLGWGAPTPIQAAVLPVALRRRDVIALAETGSGKTAAFALPVLQQLLENAHQQLRGVYCLVLAPTRELSLQITQHFLALGSSIGCTVATVVGGLDHHSQALALAKKPHVIVGTPGRVLDHLQQTKGFSLRSVKLQQTTGFAGISLTLEKSFSLSSLEIYEAYEVFIFLCL